MTECVFMSGMFCNDKTGACSKPQRQNGKQSVTLLTSDLQLYGVRCVKRVVRKTRAVMVTAFHLVGRSD